MVDKNRELEDIKELSKIRKQQCVKESLNSITIIIVVEHPKFLFQH